MLGSTFETEDAVQETMVRAWRGLDRFDGRSSLRTWLYRIATNVCLDMLNGRKRRALPMDLGPASPPVPHRSGSRTPRRAGSSRCPTAGCCPPTVTPPTSRSARDTIRLAFVAALQHLPPRQRAVLILREVLRWSAAEVAELLDTTVASVNSALQRARATLAARGARHRGPVRADGREQKELLARYVEAFTRYDIESLVALLHEDATASMPPYQLWLQGRDGHRSVARRARARLQRIGSGADRGQRFAGVRALPAGPERPRAVRHPGARAARRPDFQDHLLPGHRAVRAVRATGS